MSEKNCTDGRRFNGAKRGSKMGFSNPWNKSLMKALRNYENDKDEIRRGYALNRIAVNLLKCALDTDSPHYEFAVKEIGLRLDGKPKEHIELGLNEGTAALGIGISAAFAQLVEMQTGGKIIDGEVVVPDRSLLPAPVRAAQNGCGEGVDIQEVPGDSGKS